MIIKKTAEELRFVEAVAKALADEREGRTVSLDKAKELLGVK